MFVNDVGDHIEDSALRRRFYRALDAAGPESGIDECRRRGLNPRHADYDASARSRSSCVALGLAGFSKLKPRPSSASWRRPGCQFVATSVAQDCFKKGGICSGILFLAPYRKRVKASPAITPPAVAVVTDLDALALALAEKLGLSTGVTESAQELLTPPEYSPPCAD